MINNLKRVGNKKEDREEKSRVSITRYYVTTIYKLTVRVFTQNVKVQWEEYHYFLFYPLYTHGHSHSHMRSITEIVFSIIYVI